MVLTLGFFILYAIAIGIFVGLMLMPVLHLFQRQKRLIREEEAYAERPFENTIAAGTHNDGSGKLKAG